MEIIKSVILIIKRKFAAEFIPLNVAFYKGTSSEYDQLKELGVQVDTKADAEYDIAYIRRELIERINKIDGGEVSIFMQDGTSYMSDESLDDVLRKMYIIW